MSKIEQTKAQILEILELAKGTIIIDDKGNIELEKYLNYINENELNGYKVTSIKSIDEENANIWIDGKYKYKATQVGIDVIINAEGYFENIDTEEPNSAEITIIGENIQSSLPITLTANVVQTDAKSEIDIESCRYVLNKSIEKLGTDSSKYSEKFSSDNETIIINPTETGEWYLHVLTIDMQGNAIETIKGPITVNEKYHSHTGNWSGGGCYVKKCNNSKISSSGGTFWCDNCGTRMTASSWSNDHYYISCNMSENTLEGYEVAY